jgi:hypothetical protein
MMLDPWSFESIWGFLEAAFLVLSFTWIALFVLVGLGAVSTLVKGRRSAWVSHADLYADYPEIHEPHEGSRFDAA